jgi:hypothetical protein
VALGFYRIIKSQLRSIGRAEMAKYIVTLHADNNHYMQTLLAAIDGKTGIELITVVPDTMRPSCGEQKEPVTTNAHPARR